MAREWWKDKDLWLGLLGFGGVVAALQLAGYNAVGQISAAASDAVFAVTDVFSKGSQLSFSTMDPNGTKGSRVVTDDPETLRQAASARFGQDIDRSVYALARMIRSEGAATGALRVHVALNDLDSLGWADPFTLITYSTDSAKKGLYGEQATRRYASSEDPFTGDVQTVMAAMASHAAGNDPTNGAVKFVDKNSFGVQAGTGSFSDLVARWGQDGLTPYNVAAGGDNLVFFKKGSLDPSDTPVIA